MLFHDYLSTGRMINMIPKGNMAVLSKYTTAAIHLDILLDLIVSGNFQIQLKYLHSKNYYWVIVVYHCRIYVWKNKETSGLNPSELAHELNEIKVDLLNLKFLLLTV